jgi:hypothetical protein
LLASEVVELYAAKSPDIARATDAEAVGAETTRAITLIESVPGTNDAGNVKVTGIVEATPARATDGVVIVIADGEIAPRALADGAATVDTRPKPIADTATSAMRLRSVYVDICFLSISRFREFPDLGFG